MQIVISNPKFRIFWISTIFNDMGIIMYFTVHGFLALTVTDSAFWTGATAGMNGLGLFGFSAIGGVLADRFERRKLIIWAMLAQIVTAALIAALIFSGSIELWHILVVSFLDGMMVAVKVPARMAMTLDVAGRDRLLAATSANFVSMTLMGIIVPLLGSQIGERFNMGWAYVIMGGAYTLSVLFMILVKGVSSAKEISDSSPWSDLKAGTIFVFTTPRVRALILMALVGEAFGWAHETMLPVMARDVLDIGLAGQGYLLSAGSAGAFISSLVLSSFGEIENKGRLLIGGYVGFGFFLVLFALSPLLGVLMVSLILLGFAYAFVIVYEASLNTLLQTIVPDRMRGRVLSFQIMTWGVTGISGFHTGAIAALLGAPVAIGFGGGMVVLNALRLGRRIWNYQAQSEIASGD